MGILSSSLLVPLILDFLKERRHRKESEDFSEFRDWVMENIDELLERSADSFDEIRVSQALQDGKLDQISERLDQVVRELHGPTIQQLWEKCGEGERDLLVRMFKRLSSSPDGKCNIQIGENKREAAFLKEIGYAKLHLSSMNSSVEISKRGVVLTWAIVDPESLKKFEEELYSKLCSSDAGLRLSEVLENLDISQFLAKKYVESLADKGFIKIQSGMWPPSVTMLYPPTERYRRSSPQAIDLLQ